LEIKRHKPGFFGKARLVFGWFLGEAGVSVWESRGYLMGVAKRSALVLTHFDTRSTGNRSHPANNVEIDVEEF
jgi:hypothetical protein